MDILRELYLMRDCGIRYTSYCNKKYQVEELIKLIEWKQLVAA